MGSETSISWCDATLNFWIGCSKVSAGCDFCYAERENERRKWAAGWGPGVPRHRTKSAPANALAWNRKAARNGTRPRVFCSSLSDVFDNEVPDEWRVDLWDLIRNTPNLRWMLLTKRIGNAPKMLPPDWPFPHAGLMSTLVNQVEWDRDIDKLLSIPAAWHGVSVEPMLGPINIGQHRPDWIICGGESGPNRRFIDPGWVRSLRDQCAEAGTAFHFKQWSGVRAGENGCMLDGREHKAFPPALA
jgi:protein gp37